MEGLDNILSSPPASSLNNILSSPPDSSNKIITPSSATPKLTNAERCKLKREKRKRLFSPVSIPLH